jgi:hypothetical protein
MDKDQIVEWLSNNLSLESRMLYDIMGNPMGTEIKIEIFHEKEPITLAQTEFFFD